VFWLSLLLREDEPDDVDEGRRWWHCRHPQRLEVVEALLCCQQHHSSATVTGLGTDDACASSVRFSWRKDQRGGVLLFLVHDEGETMD
jgi:hypothetical protein